MNNPFSAWRRLLQFRLRFLLLFILVAAIALTWHVRSREPPRLGLDGYCPVTLVHKNIWEIGDPQYDAVYEGRLYLFAGPKEQKLFESYPDRYAPISAGADIVRLSEENRRVNGERAHGLTYNGRIYLFDSEYTLNIFCEAPDRYAKLGKRSSARSQQNESPISIDYNDHTPPTFNTFGIAVGETNAAKHDVEPARLLSRRCRR